MFIISRSAGKSNRAPVKKNCPPQLTVKAALWYDNKVCGRRFPAHGLPVRIHVCGSSVTLRLGFLTESKSEDSKIAAERAVAHICGYGGNGRLGGFRFLCREACGFESHYPYQNEHHPCFEIFYRNTDGFLFGKPRGTRLSAFFVYSLCISGNIKNAKMFLYASVAI